MVRDDEHTVLAEVGMMDVRPSMSKVCNENNGYDERMMLPPLLQANGQYVFCFCVDCTITDLFGRRARYLWSIAIILLMQRNCSSAISFTSVDRQHALACNSTCFSRLIMIQHSSRSGGI